MRWSRPKWMIRQFFRIFFSSILCILIIVACITFFSTFFPNIDKKDKYFKSIYKRRSVEVSSKKFHHQYLLPVSQAPERHITVFTNGTSPINQIVSFVPANGRSNDRDKFRRKCAFYSCFNIYQCGRLGQDRLSIYVYPIERIFVNGQLLQDRISKEFYQIIEAIVQSPYYVNDPNQACVFVPTIDLLNLKRFLSPSSPVTMNHVLLALQGLPHWGSDGANHIIFSMFPNSHPLTALSTAAILVSSSFSTTEHRLGFYIPFLTFSPNGIKQISLDSVHSTRRIFCVAAEGSKSEDFFQDKILVLDYCRHNVSNYSIRCKDTIVYPYPEVLKMSDFCIVESLAHPILWDAMSMGCIPVILPGTYRLPFDEVIDWTRNAIILYEHQIPEIGSILRGISARRKERLKSQVRFTFERYFESVPRLISTVLELVKERVFPHAARTLHQWNYNPLNSHKISPIFNPVFASNSAGFTAVILAYERIQSLFQVMQRLEHVSSLAKIIIVWNNQKRSPPPESAWPKISKPFKIIQTSRNKMSNRFYPYADIQTEAIFALDDDIVMLTPDEINFAFQVWREFPDRLVGFPSRTHIWDNSTSRWKYESEWTNEVSMVLTGAAFYHKFWHYAYFNEMPQEIREAVDDKMNCEDIAMNFLIANRTGKPPIKVTPRKKFKCPTCSNNEMLSADTAHMRERTDCINQFAAIYGYMPLQAIEFRADPVLYKVDKLPKRLKKFAEIGTL